MISAFDQAVKDIIATGQRLGVRGLAPGAAGNYSIRLKDGRIVITVSGRHKGRLTPADLMLVDENGKALEDKKPSDETLLHTHIYSVYPEACAVLHGHSIVGLAITRFSGADEIVFENYEMLKIFPGIDTHEATLRIPIVDNSQDMVALSKTVDARLSPENNIAAYIIRDHGFYTWGRNIQEAEHIAEALEHLLLCELELMKLNAGAKS